jgi:hypothetical protein
VEIQYPAGASYSVDWGDSTLPSSSAGGGGGSGSANATLNHTFANSGTYVISLKDGSGAVKATSVVGISN